MKILILGNGYLGNRCKEVWGDEAIISGAFIHTKEDVLKVLDEVNPDVVLNAAGITGKPNVDWCETHPMETMLGNTLLPILVAEACQERGKYLLHMGTGCIFYGDSHHEDKMWRENDMGNPKEVVYTRTKWAADLVLSTLPNVGIARIRMPIDSRSCPSNLIDKLVKYEKVVDVENSVTIVEDMIDVFHKLLEKKAEGIFHVVNRGVMRHKDLIDLYKELVDPNHTNEWLTAQQLVDLGLATKTRSNNILASENLEKLGIQMPEIHESLRRTMEKYAQSKKELIQKEISGPVC
ncbi:MAG: sugar nucleotide-binding protein [Candidatus Magasanikbacteria bacterium]